MAQILVIDTDPAITTLLERVLSRAGHEVRAAEHSVEAAALARRWPPAVILIDLPSAAGIKQPLRYFRANPATASVPLLALSARCDVDEADARAAGYDGFVAKPFFKAQLLAQVVRCL
jgi:CheY-like chemotaxis protein